MRNIKKIRFKQVRQYGWTDAEEIGKESNKSRLMVYCDILYCFFKYGLWSNQYKDNKFWLLTKEERNILGRSLGSQNRGGDAQKQIQMNEYDNWSKDYNDNRKFIDKYSSYHWETSPRLRRKRLKAYSKQYNMGKDCIVQYAVELCREHHMNGTIEIGNRVLFSKHVFVDYSGKVIIRDNVQLANGVIIENHFHKFHSDWKQQDKYLVEPSYLTIEHDAMLGSKAIIMPSCHYIGIHSRVGAGAVVTHDVPDYAIVAGVPARVIKIMEH